MVNTVSVIVLLVIIALAAWYVVRAKKNGKKCIGCPNGGSCAGKNNNGCSYSCMGCNEE